MVCPTCKTEGERSIVTLWGVRQQVSGLVQWDEDGKRVAPSQPESQYTCSRGHRWFQ